MGILNKKTIIILGSLFAAVLILLLVSYIITAIHSPKKPGDDNNGKTPTENITYPTITDSAQTILAKVYNPRYNYYAGFINEKGEYENIFGNETELSVANLSPKTKMTIALNSISYNNMQTITCNKVSLSGSSICGSKNTKIAYALRVQDLNDKIYEIFGYDIDYTALDTNNLIIGSCVGQNSYCFKYYEKDGLFVSLYSRNCSSNGSIKVTKVTKSQMKELLTLDVYYEKRILNTRTKKVIRTIKNHDKFFFNVQKNGDYYLYSTTLVEKNLK